MKKGEDIAERLVTFAVRIIKLADALPKTSAGRAICGQIVRSGMSPGANYEEARAAESKADFGHKLGITLKELRETRYWLRIIEHAELLPGQRLEEIAQEAEELCRIIGKSIVTVKNNAK